MEIDTNCEGTQLKEEIPSFSFSYPYKRNDCSYRGVLLVYHRADWTLIDVVRLDSQFSRGEKLLFFTGECVNLPDKCKKVPLFRASGQDIEELSLEDHPSDLIRHKCEFIVDLAES